MCSSLVDVASGDNRLVAAIWLSCKGISALRPRGSGGDHRRLLERRLRNLDHIGVWSGFLGSAGQEAASAAGPARARAWATPPPGPLAATVTTTSTTRSAPTRQDTRLAQFRSLTRAACWHAALEPAPSAAALAAASAARSAAECARCEATTAPSTVRPPRPTTRITATAATASTVADPWSAVMATRRTVRATLAGQPKRRATPGLPTRGASCGPTRRP